MLVQFYQIDKFRAYGEKFRCPIHVFDGDEANNIKESLNNERYLYEWDEIDQLIDRGGCVCLCDRPPNCLFGGSMSTYYFHATIKTKQSTFTYFDVWEVTDPQPVSKTLSEIKEAIKEHFGNNIQIDIDRFNNVE